MHRDADAESKINWQIHRGRAEQERERRERAQSNVELVVEMREAGAVVCSREELLPFTISADDADGAGLLTRNARAIAGTR